MSSIRRVYLKLPARSRPAEVTTREGLDLRYAPCLPVARGEEEVRHDNMVRPERTVLNAAPGVADFRGNDSSLLSVLKTLLFFTFLMIALPIGLYFGTKSYVFEGTLGMSNRDSYFYAAIVAVVAVHIVLALFVYVAWNEGSKQWRDGKQD
ncbi:vacuolar ATPase assembly integral membrane protein vma21 [Hypanus sabinus]|uniref:vacuolar ATPase assembly integral membrane protein vma21 n=2 Tax=Dasyatidae TaxID=30469 RepID=UPI0028C487FF|nr:vacuolar ATPase assembly integral membrane protein vma21 [Hypanus sabinus]